MILDPGVSHSRKLDQLSGLLLLFLSNSQQSAVACVRRVQTSQLGLFWFCCWCQPQLPIPCHFCWCYSCRCRWYCGFHDTYHGGYFLLLQLFRLQCRYWCQFFVDELVVLLQQFMNLRLLLVYLVLMFPDDLQQIIVLSCHLLYVLFVGSCRYRYFAEIGC